MIIMPIVSLVLMPIVGPVIDRFSYKKIIILGQLFSIVSLIAYGATYATPYGQKHLFLNAVLIITALKITDQFVSTTQMAARHQLVLDDDLQAVTGYIGSANGATSLLSSVVGGAIYMLVPFPFFVFLEIVTELATLAITLTLDYNFNTQPTEVEEVVNDSGSFIDGIKYLYSRKSLFVFLLEALFLNFAISGVNVGLPILALKTLKLSSFEFGLIEGAASLGYILAGLVFAKMASPKYPLVLAYRTLFVNGALNMLEAGLLLLPLHNMGYFIGLAIFQLIVSATTVFINNPFFMIIQTDIPTQYQGRILNLDMSISMAIMPIATALFGLLYDLKGIELKGLITLVFFLVGTSIILINFLAPRISKVDYKKV
jgi:MFS family permease